MEVLMIRFRSLIAGVLMASLLASGAAFAQSGPPDRPDRPGGRRVLRGPGSVGLPLAQLNLTDSQRQQVRDLTQKRRESGAQVEEQLRAAMTARRTAMETLPVNEGAIRATTADLIAAETEAAILRAHFRADIIGLLTPEQQNQLKKLEAQRAQRAQTRRQGSTARRQR
jgi:periplasmic protein CpxP/Spy